MMRESNAAHGPLAGIRILDLSSVIMGPLATQIFGDLGADVIVVEGARLDTNRVMGAGPHPMLSGIALNLLRNKRSVCVDLKDSRGREVFLRLAETSDVLVTNLRPGPLRRLQLDYDHVAAVRSDIVCCQAHGFPSDGDRPSPTRTSRVSADPHPNRRPQRTSDGWINVLPYSMRHYDELFRKGGRVDLLGDPRIASGRARIANSDFLYEVVAGIMPMQTTEEWLAFCRDSNIPASALADLDDLVDALPNAIHPLVGDYKLVPPPVRFSRTAAEVRRSAPLPGQHNHEVLRDVGLSDQEIRGLEQAGILSQGPSD